MIKNLKIVFAILIAAVAIFIAIIAIIGITSYEIFYKGTFPLFPPQEQTSTPPGANYPALDDLIKVENIAGGEKISSPVRIAGQARGPWYFEAVFPVQITGVDGAVLGSGQAQAQGDWMTDEYVPFNAVISFNSGNATSGFIILKKDNPSGLPQNDNQLEIPVKF